MKGCHVQLVPWSFQGRSEDGERLSWEGSVQSLLCPGLQPLLLCCITSLLLYLLSLGVVHSEQANILYTEGQRLLAGHGRAPSLGLTGPFLHIDPS